MIDIAVIIPCFNSGRTVGEAVDSVLAQTRPAAEVIVVDDGSRDIYTRQFLSSLSRPRVRVIASEHRGASGARNHGAALTSAPCLLFLDADDALDREYLEKTGACLDAEPDLDFVSTAMRGFGEVNYVWTPPQPDLRSAFTRGTIPITALLHRRVWDSVGGFDETLPISMDLDFWIRVFEQRFRGRVIDEPLLFRRVRSDSLHHSAVASDRYRNVLEQIFRKHRETIDELGPDLLIAKESFIAEQRRNKEQLEHSRPVLGQQLRALDEEIARVQTCIRQQGERVVDFGDLQRVTPISPFWGLERGRPLDRYYIERFLARHRSDIRGRVLEIKDPYYTEMFGSDKVTERDVLDIVSGNPFTTIVADLTHADGVPDESFDCFILTQTLHIIYDVRAALSHAQRILKPGGVLLATLPAVSRINYEDGGIDRGDFWRFTEASLRHLLGEVFPLNSFEIFPQGNLKACIAFLYGVAVEEVPQSELDRHDPRCPLSFCVRAVKVSARPPRYRATTLPEPTAAILMYHRIASLPVDPHRLCVSAREFRDHIQLLAQRYSVLSLEELAQALAEGTLRDNAIAITLDDGTLDSLETASPILGQSGVPATFFINTERIGEAHEAWWDVLGRIFLGGDVIPTVLDISIGLERQVFPTEHAEGRSSAYAVIHRYLMKSTLSQREKVMSFLVHWSGLALEPRRTHRLLLAGEVRQLADQPGVTIGAHSVHHLFLPSLSRDEQQTEVAACRRDLEHLLEQSVTLFSYPYGARGPETAEIVRAAGFRAAVTTEPAAVSSASDVFALPRLDVKADGVAGLMLALDDAFAAARRSS